MGGWVRPVGGGVGQASSWGGGQASSWGGQLGGSQPR